MFKLFYNISNKVLIVLALFIVASTLWYTNNLASQFKIEEEKKVALWAKATKELSNLNNSNIDVGFIFDVVNNNTTIPAILVNDNGAIVHSINLQNSKTAKAELDLMKKRYPNQRITIDLIDGTNNYIYYKDSKLLQRLKYFPFFIFLIIAAFMAIAYSAFSNARIAQQNKVWTGMAKETAHQIGTPLSSLMGWLEHLKDNNTSNDVSNEIEKDLKRLGVIASRFSKIGSLPTLEKQDLIPILQQSINYMRDRASSKISFRLVSQSKPVYALINRDLFEWVIENMIKNSIDGNKIHSKPDRYGTSVDGPLQLVQQAVVHEGGIFTVSIKDGSPSPRLTTHMYFNALRSMAMFRSGYLYAGRESWCKRSRLGHEPLSSHHHH